MGRSSYHPMPNFENLIEALSKQLQIPKGQLQTAIQSGNPKTVAALLSGKQAQAFQKILSDPKAAQRILSSKEAQDLQKKIES